MDRLVTCVCFSLIASGTQYRGFQIASRGGGAQERAQERLKREEERDKDERERERGKERDGDERGGGGVLVEGETRRVLRAKSSFYFFKVILRE